MAHLDRLTYFGQIFYFFLFFWLSYIILAFLILPRMFKSIKLRDMLILHLVYSFSFLDYKKLVIRVFLLDFLRTHNSSLNFKKNILQ